jgi:Flp pilus assembly protein TadD
MTDASEHDHGGHGHGLPTAVDVEAEAARGLRGLGALLLVVGALSLSGGLWLLLRTPGLEAPGPVGLAVAALGEGDPSTALQHAERAAREAPDDAGAWLARGRALRALGRDAEARESLERACALAPQRWEVHVELARACLALGDVQRARMAWGAARAAAPDEPGVLELEAELGG